MIIRNIAVASTVIVLVAACGNSEPPQPQTTEEQTMGDKLKGFADTVKVKTQDMAESTGEAVAKAGETVSEKTSALMDKGRTMAADTMTAAKERTAEVVASAKERVQEATTDAKAALGMAPAAEAQAPAIDLAMGESVYGRSCTACHGSGAAGAPKLDDPSWGERKAQGTEVLVRHAIEGYKGTTGYMPPKGGAMSIPDDQVAAAVHHMVSQTQQ